MGRTLFRWWRGHLPADAWGPVRDWARARGAVLKPVREPAGFVIESIGAGADIRLEWGASQRRYLGRQELRLRAETGVDPGTYALLMPRALLEGLEREVYAQYTEGVQTRLDDQTPEEMRWLAMSPRLSATQLGPLRTGFAAISNAPHWMSAWLDGPVQAQLLEWESLPPGGADAPGAAALAGRPLFALLAYRGQLVLRRSLSVPEVLPIESTLALFERVLQRLREHADQALPESAPD